jgi:protein O-GlcNAc transferase
LHSADPPVPAESTSEPARYREVKFRHSRDFVGLLNRLGVSLLISTYQAGKLVTVGARDSTLNISLHNFEQAMGLALHPRRLAVGSRGVIWFLQNAVELAPRLDPPGHYDACYLTRQSFSTGNIHGHEMAWVGDELWIVNTLFSCLCTLHEDFSFAPRWKPPFITDLEANDRCHLNGMALDAGRPKYVTVMAPSNEPGGWRPTKTTSGQLLEISSGQVVTQGLAMPHSPRVYGGRLWVLNSGLGALEIVDPASGRRDTVATVPGYTRGLAFHEQYAFVGMSRIRETAVFGGVPIAEKRDELRCAVAVVDLKIGQAIAFLEFETGVEEIFDVQVLPGARSVSVTGPYPVQDDAKDVWVVPPPGQVPRSAAGVFAGQGPASLSDDDITALVRDALAAQQQGKANEAVELLARAVAARPNAAPLHNHLGNAWQDTNRQDLAQQCYERAVAVDESFAPAHQNLGYLLINFGRLDDGLAHLQRAQQLQPSAVNRVMLATSLPVIYHSLDDVRARREKLEAEVQRLVDDKVEIDTRDALIPTNFFAAYQGCNDRDVQRNLGRVFRGVDLVKRAAHRKSQGRIRLGMLSAHFRDHTIGRLNLGRASLLDRQKFELTVITSGHHNDSMAQEFHRRADRHVELPGKVEAARRAVAELNLDVLLFADVGMNALTYTLAMSRMAPVQCVTWGHPISTGSAAMDYFLSSRLLETDQGDDHYTERLVRLANLGTYYYRPKLADARRTRESFGLDSARHFYFCPQTLFKLHPEFDPIVAEILRRDPLGDVVFIEGRQPQWTRLLKERFERTMPDVAARVRFLQPQPNAAFLELNALADVLLDSIHFGGGNTSYEGLAVGTPIVTLPGPFLRSRITLALYRKMQLDDCIADTAEQYVEQAVRLGTDADYRRATSARIQASSPILYEDPAEVREFERAIRWIAEGGQGTFT